MARKRRRQQGRIIPESCVFDLATNMPIKDRIQARSVSDELAQNIARANRSIKSLTIVISSKIRPYHFIDKIVNGNSLSAHKGARMLTNSDGTPRYPMYKHHNMNTLQVKTMTSGFVNWIVRDFSSVKELRFVNCTSKSREFSFLTKILKSDTYRQNLRALTIVDRQTRTHSVKLFDAINHLQNIKSLVLILRRLTIRDLPILQQLKFIRADVKQHNYQLLIENIKKYVPVESSSIEIDLSGASPNFDQLISLQEQTRARIVRYTQDFIGGSTMTLCSITEKLPMLRSISLNVHPEQYAIVCRALKELKHLRIVSLYISFLQAPYTEPMHAPRKAECPLPQVETLELGIHLTSHMQTEWLNVATVFPCIESLYVYNYRCAQCTIDIEQLRNPRSLNWIARFPRCTGTFFTNIWRHHKQVKMRYHNQRLFAPVQSLIDFNHH